MKQRRKSKNIPQGPKQISFRRLTLEALPEMWSFQILTALLMAVPASILSKLMAWTAESAGGAMTTADLGGMLGWRTPVLLLLGGLLLFWYIVWEIFAQIHMHEDVLSGRRAGILQEVRRGIRSFRRFLSPAGILILLYIFIVVPLCGIGFSVSLSRTFYIPNFIMDVIHSTPLYAIAYTVLMAALAVIGWRSLFSVHAMLIDGMTPSEARRESRYGWKFLLMIGVFILIFPASILLGLFYHQVFERPEPVKVIAHRAGGTEASENSVEGLYAAIEYGCYGSEIDVQRTKDGYYIINHDSDFKRLTGTARSPRDMTMEEIRTLRIQDTTGSGAELPVATLEEMLDVIRGKGKLFLELKGSTADRKMVDDLARIIREKDCIQDVALISLDYGIIDYAETNYPEFETGTLFFAGIGNVARLNCDLLIMEEQIATDLRVEQVHHAGKQAIVWTVNTPESMYRFLDSNVDAVITDEIKMAEETQSTLDARSDLQVIRDKITNLRE